MDLITISKDYTIYAPWLTEAERDALAAVYAALPGYLGYSPRDGCPAWFGWPPEECGEEGGAYLWASVEPSGLLVCGQLPPELWAEWDGAFMTMASEALGFPVRDADEYPFGPS